MNLKKSALGSVAHISIIQIFQNRCPEFIRRGVFIYRDEDAAVVTSAPVPQSPAAALSLADALGRLARNRDPVAWEALLLQCGPDIQRVTRRILGDAALAEDACQETLLQLRAHAGSFKAPVPPQQAQFAARIWIMRIASNTAISLARSRARARRRDDQHAVAAPRVDSVSPAERQLKEEEAAELRREIAALPDTLREPVLLRFFGELDYAELGSALACSPDAAKKRVQRGLEHLRARLAALGVSLTLADLSTHLLGGGSAHAAEAVAAAASAASLNASQHAAWQSLLNTQVAPALSGVVPLGGMTLMVKLSMAAASLAIVGSCAALAGYSMNGSGSARATAPLTGKPVISNAAKSGSQNEPKDDEITPTPPPDAATPAPPVPAGNPPAKKASPAVPDKSRGGVKGRVKFNGVPPAPKKTPVPNSNKADCHHDEIVSEELVVDPKTNGIKWAMIRILGVNDAPPAQPFGASSIDQKGCMFQPHVVIVAPGSNLNVMNSEKAAHNFHITPLDAANPGFNRMMMSLDGTMTLKGSKYFLEPEVIKMQCDIHPWMNGFIVCHDPRFAAISAADGAFEIPSVPPGKYDVSIFHELGEQTFKIEIKTGQTVDMGDVLFPAKAK